MIVRKMLAIAPRLSTTHTIGIHPQKYKATAIIPNAITILGTANEQGCEALNTSSDALRIANELTGDNAEIPQASFDRVCN